MSITFSNTGRSKVNFNQIRSLFKREHIPKYALRSLFKREHIPKYVIGFASSFVPGGWPAMAALAYWRRKRQQKVIAIDAIPTTDKPN